MAIADFGAGAQVGLKQLLLERVKAQKYADDLKQQAFENQRQLAGDARANRALDETSALRKATEADAARQKTYGEANTLADQIPGDTFLGEHDPAVATMQQGGRGSLLTQTPEVKPMGEDFQGPMQGGVTPEQAQVGRAAGFLKTRSAKQIDTETDNARQASTAQAAIDAKIEGLHQAAEHLRMQGEVNAANILRAQAEAAAANAKTNKPATVNLSPGGKSARAAIEQAAPLTDQVMEMIRKEAPDIETNPGKYNGVMSKLTSLGQTLKYKAGFHDDTDPRQQLVSLLQPIQAGQYTRSSRSRQMLDLALKHMADPSQTLLTQYQRAKELKSIMPEMLEGIVRAEQPVDPSNPLGGSYLDPKKGAGATGTKPTAEDLIQKYGGR